MTDVREIVDRDTSSQLQQSLLNQFGYCGGAKFLLRVLVNLDSVLSFVPWLATSKSEEYFVKEIGLSQYVIHRIILRKLHSKRRSS